jgi:hypothetical protein
MNEEDDVDYDIEETDEGEEESELAKEFREHCEKTQARIDEKLDKARKYLREAVELSEKAGVPFDSDISFLSNGYVPNSFTGSKYANLDNEVISEITGVYGEYIDFDCGGWEHSAVC